MAALRKQYRNDRRNIMDRTTCHKCHKKGHWKANCPENTQRSNEEEKASKATEEETDVPWYEFDEEDDDNSEDHAMMVESSRKHVIKTHYA